MRVCEYEWSSDGQPVAHVSSSTRSYIYMYRQSSTYVVEGPGHELQLAVAALPRLEPVVADLLHARGQPLRGFCVVVDTWL